jgi:uncharacterized protein involved in exopolysaccharide biosynthesis
VDGADAPAPATANSPASSTPPAQISHPQLATIQPVAHPGAGTRARGSSAHSQSSPVATAIAANKPLVCICALLFAVFGVLAGMHRKGTYSSAATLQVGKVNPNSPGFYGFVQSASDLATAFSRAVTAEAVLDAVHARLGLSAATAVSRLAAEPIPNSPAFRVIASGPTAKAAVNLANVASTALIAYEAHANTYSPEGHRLLGAYRAAELSLAHAKAAVARAEAARGEEPSAKANLRLENAQASQAAATLQAQALASGYQLSAQSATTRDLISPLAQAVTATSDRRSKIELLGFVGLLGGLVIGCALAALREIRAGARRPG